MVESEKLPSNVAYHGKLFEVIQSEQPDGRVFERAVRAPGVRLIVADKPAQKLLLTREFRQELNGWDFRLPGGKVFDSLEEYDSFKAASGDINQAAAEKAKAEGLEEAGLNISDLTLFKKSTLGATVEWDLFVFEVNDWREAESGQQLEVGEQIEADSWFGYDEARRMILNGQIQEERIALLLFRWLEKQSVE